MNSCGKLVKHTQTDSEYVGSDCVCDCACDCEQQACSSYDRSERSGRYDVTYGYDATMSRLMAPQGSDSWQQKWYLMLTPTCNHRCPGCGNEFIVDYTDRRVNPALPSRPLSRTEWNLILDKIAAHATSLIVTGGEPTLHTAFDQIIEQIDQLAIPFTVFTNGDWSNPGRILTCLAGSPHLRGLLVSLHGVDAVTHEAFTGTKGSFDNTVANVRLCIDAGIPVRLSTIITRHSSRQVGRIIDLARQLGVTGIGFNRYLVSPDQAFACEALPADEQLADALQYVGVLCNETVRTGFTVTHGGPRVPQCFSSSSMRGCSAGEKFCAIDPWANVMPCIHTDWRCGNLLEQETLEILQSEPMRQWREMVPADCMACAVFSQCRGGCRAAMARFGGKDPLMRSPLASAN